MTIRHIVVGLDGSEHSRRAASWAASLATDLDADVVGLHALGLLHQTADGRRGLGHAPTTRSPRSSKPRGARRSATHRRATAPSSGGQSRSPACSSSPTRSMPTSSSSGAAESVAFPVSCSGARAPRSRNTHPARRHRPRTVAMTAAPSADANLLTVRGHPPPSLGCCGLTPVQRQDSRAGPDSGHLGNGRDPGRRRVRSPPPGPSRRRTGVAATLRVALRRLSVPPLLLPPLPRPSREPSVPESTSTTDTSAWSSRPATRSSASPTTTARSMKSPRLPSPCATTNRDAVSARSSSTTSPRSPRREGVRYFVAQVMARNQPMRTCVPRRRVRSDVVADRDRRRRSHPRPRAHRALARRALPSASTGGSALDRPACCHRARSPSSERAVDPTRSVTRSCGTCWPAASPDRCTR